MERKIYIILTITAIVVLSAVLIATSFNGKYWKMVASLLGSEESSSLGLNREDCLKSAAIKLQGVMKEAVKKLNSINPAAVQERKDAMKMAADELNAATASASQIKNAELEAANKISDKTDSDAAIKDALDKYSNNKIVEEATEKYRIAVKAANDAFNQAVGEQALKDYHDAVDSTQAQYKIDIANCPAK
jgi:hypothetical protein